MNLVFMALSVQIVLGALDNLWHHEITERLPAKRFARTELALHGVRELLYALLFLAIAWWQWHGLWAWLLAGVLAVEILVTLADFLVEDATRTLPGLERILHTLLAINVGVVLTLFVPLLAQWARAPTQVLAVDHGSWSWWFTAASVGVGAWSLRDLLAVAMLSRPPPWQRRPLHAGHSASPRTVLVTGATGFIGTRLCRMLIEAGDSLVVLARDPERARDRLGPLVRIVTDLGEIQDDEPIDAVVNLAGAAVLGPPWSRRRRATLLRSRLTTTRAVVRLIRRAHRRPRVLISASAVGRYGVHEDRILDENAAGQPIFQSRLCRAWEREALQARSHATRVCLLRMGLVLGCDGGALPQMARPVRFGLGAVLGDGRQWMSWIHMDDLLRVMHLALTDPRMHGPVNATAPHPVRHGLFMHSVARALHRPLWLRVPARVLRPVLGEMGQLLLDGQRVIPRVLQEVGFRFHHPCVEDALKDLLGKPRPPLSHRAADACHHAGATVDGGAKAHEEKQREATA